MLKPLISIVTFSLALVLSGCASEGDGADSASLNTEFEPEGVLDFQRPDSSIITRIVIEFSETPEEQAQGLMFRRTMPERGGMLFVNQEEVMKSFWMRNTAISLDILFVDAAGEIVNIVTNTTPFSDEQVLSTAPAQYVVEVKAGFTARYGITEDDRISWRRESFDEKSDS